MQNHFSLIDKICLEFDKALKTLAPNSHKKAERFHGAENLPEADLSLTEKKQAAALMRVNHVGEVCAQALYQGQAMTAHLDSVKEQMKQASDEEQDHLIWCANRIHELDGHTSYLTPFFYCGAYTMGAIAGAIGDRWSLGFVAETEKQVTVHLESHLERLPIQDRKTKIILEKMRAEEIQHAETAIQAGGAELPSPIKKAMELAAKCMTNTAYYV